MAAADLIVENAKVITLDSSSRLVEAMAVRDGRIAALGASEEVRRLLGPATRVIDGYKRVHAAGDLTVRMQIPLSVPTAAFDNRKVVDILYHWADMLRLSAVTGHQLTWSEADRGTLEVGKAADFLVLGDDPLSCDEDAVKDIPVEPTFVAGREVFTAPSVQADGSSQPVTRQA